MHGTTLVLGEEGAQSLVFLTDGYLRVNCTDFLDDHCHLIEVLGILFFSSFRFSSGVAGDSFVTHAEAQKTL